MSILSATVGFELSVNQKALWDECRNRDISQFYNQIVIGINGPLQTEKLVAALRAVIRRHEVLSYVCVNNDQSVYPFQAPASSVEVEIAEGKGRVKDIGEAISGAIEHFDRPYDPFKDLPVRFFLCDTDELRHFLVVRIFSLWADSFSCDAFCRDLGERYLGVAEEKEMIEYRNFSKWQNELFGEPDEEGKIFWERHPAISEEVLPFGRVSVTGFSAGRRVVAFLTADKYKKFKSAESLLSLFAAYLGRFSENDFTVGIVPFNRSYEELNDTIGLVSKALPIRFTRESLVDRDGAVAYVDRSIKEAISYGDYFFESPSFSYLFEYIQPDLREAQGGYTSFDLVDIGGASQCFDLKLRCIDSGDALKIELWVNEQKIDAAEAGVIEGQLRQIFQGWPETGFGPAEAGEAERQLIGQWNDTHRELDAGVTVLSLFEEQVRKAPENIALVDGEQHISYGKLHVLADGVCRFLQDNYSIGRGDVVGVQAERSPKVIAALLGIMKAGAAYVLLDPELPASRLRYILEDSGARVLLSEPSARTDRFADAGIGVVDIPTAYPAGNREGSEAERNVGAGGVAYIMYTSGSTGMPKGCIVSHDNLSNYIRWSNDYYFGDSCEGNWALITPMTFDLTVTCLYTSLTRGKRLHIGDRNKEITELLSDCFRDPRIDTLKLTPAHLSLLKGLKIEKTTISTLICGGEQLTREQVDRKSTRLNSSHITPSRMPSSA